ncbi:MAG TPA: EAL domain-containing protein, partial [Planctomycetota bacterium]|nr:EAL domain-containing protein [Planctomycetota bacterium]
VEVAKALGKKTIAKGVESAETLSVLWELGVDYVQGNYLQEGDAELNYQFEDQATLTSEHVPPWAVADSDKSR